MISAQGALSPKYKWSPSAGLNNTSGSSVTASPLTTTTYTITALNQCGKQSTASVTINVNSIPTLTLNVSNSTICLGQSSNITVSGADSYTWSPSNGLDATDKPSINASPLVSTTYTVTGKSQCGMVSSATVAIAVNPNPVVSVYPGSATICRNALVQLMASGSTSYTWTPAVGLSATTGSVVIASPHQSVSYTVTGINTNGCPNTAVVDVINDCSNEILGCCFSNYGASVYVTSTTNLNIYCNLLNEVGGITGNVLEKGDFENTGSINVFRDWIHNAKNDLYVIPRDGVSSLFGADQKMMGNSNTKFYQLDLDGNGVKYTLIDEYNEATLNLKTNELALTDYTFHVENNDVNTITGSPMSLTAGQGFVSTDGLGYLSRNMVAGLDYLFPLGSKLNKYRFRPVSMLNNSEIDYPSVGFTNENPSPFYDISLKAPNVKALNTQYYHRIKISNAASTDKTIKSYFPKNDGSFQSIAHWEQDPSKLLPTYWWGSTPSSGVNNTPNVAGLVYALTNGQQTFDDIPFILAQSGFYIKTTQFGDPVPVASIDPDNPQVTPPPKTVITVTSTSGTSPTGGLGDPFPTGPGGGNTGILGGGPTVYTPSPVPGSYVIDITPANDCGIPGKINFTINNDGTIDPSSVVYSLADGNPPLGELSQDVYSIDNYNSGIDIKSTPSSILDQCVNSIVVTFGETKDFVFEKASETNIEVFVPTNINNVSLSSFDIKKNDGTLVLSNALTISDNTIAFNTVASSLPAGVYNFIFSLTTGSDTKDVKGQFILK